MASDVINQMNAWKSYVSLLVDQNARDENKLKAAQELAEDLEVSVMFSIEKRIFFFSSILFFLFFHVFSILYNILPHFFYLIYRFDLFFSCDMLFFLYHVLQ